MIAFCLISFLFAPPAIGLAAANRRLLPDWSTLRLNLLSSAPLPALVLAESIWLYVDAGDTPRERCGVDACGMAMLAASMFGMVAVAGFLASAAACRLYLSRTCDR